MVVTWAAQRDDGVGTLSEGAAGGLGILGVAVRELVASSKRYLGEACGEVRVLRNSDTPASFLQSEEGGGRIGTAREIITTRYRSEAAIHRTGELGVRRAVWRR